MGDHRGQSENDLITSRRRIQEARDTVKYKNKNERLMNTKSNESNGNPYCRTCFICPGSLSHPATAQPHWSRINSSTILDLHERRE
jgi:hypothetical protein